MISGHTVVLLKSDELDVQQGQKYFFNVFHLVVKFCVQLLFVNVSDHTGNE
jgi:hypothetical protein